MKKKFYSIIISLSLIGFTSVSQAAACYNEHNNMIAAQNNLATMSRSDPGYFSAETAANHAAAMYAYCHSKAAASIEG